MKNTLLFLSLLTAVYSCSPKGYTVIRNVAVFDGERVYEKVNFVFSEDRIIAITPHERHYKNANLIDGKGQTILPPLINAHVHVREAQNLKDALSVGIFGMLDMFSTDRHANQLRVFNDSLTYARFYSSNVGATVPGGHGTQYNISIPTIGDSITPAQFVEARLRENADYIKLTQEYSMAKLSKDQINELVAAAHTRGKIVVAHISDLENGLALAAGHVDGLAHIWHRSDSRLTPERLALLQEEDIFIIPTLSVVLKVIDRAAELGLATSYLSKEEVQREVRQAHESGIPILAGTDSPNYNMDFTTQYFAELLLLQEAGLSNVDVLKAATSNIYQRFNLPEFGILEADAPASFTLVAGEPQLELAEIKNAKRVWKRGVEIM